MLKRLVLLMLMAVVATTATPSVAEQGSTRIVTKNYQFGAAGEFVGLVCRNNAPSIGGACFGLDFGERTVTVTVQDDENWPVAGAYFFTDPLGRSWGHGWFCQSFIANIPPGPTEIDVYAYAEGMTGSIPFWNTFFLGPDCGLDYRPATSGTITAEFYRPWQ